MTTAFEFAFSDHGQNGSRDPEHRYGAVFLASWVPGQGCRVVNTYGSGGYGLCLSVAIGEMSAPRLMGQAHLPEHPEDNLLYDVMYLHDGAPNRTPCTAEFPGRSSMLARQLPARASAKPLLASVKPMSGRSQRETSGRRFQKGTGAKGNLYQYKGHHMTAFTYADPWHKQGDLLTATLATDNHASYHNADSHDEQPVFLFTTNVCGLAGGAGGAACPPSYPSPLWDEIIAVENQVAHASARHCDYGGGPNTAACQYRFAHTFNTGTNWNFQTQNAIGNVSPNGRFAFFPSDWNLQLGCTDGSPSGCVDNISGEYQGLLQLRESRCQKVPARGCLRG